MMPQIGSWYTEIASGVAFYCTSLTDQHVCLAYRQGDPIAVSPNLDEFVKTFEPRASTQVYAWQGYLHDLRTHRRVRGLTRREETFVVNEGCPTRLLAGPGEGSTVRVTDVGALDLFNQSL